MNIAVNRNYQLMQILLISCIILLGAVVHGDSDFPFKTVIDILSENAEFSELLRIIQRQGFVSYLNELQNYTLLAPVNSAFVNNEDADAETDFMLEKYIIKESILQTELFSTGTTVIGQDVLHPLLIEKTISSDGNYRIKINEAVIVDPNLTPNFQNATVHGISHLLDEPPALINLVKQLEERTGKFSLIGKFIENTPLDYPLEHFAQNNTILIPSDNNFHRYFNQLEINYIIDNFSRLDTLSRKIEKSWVEDRFNLWKNIIIYDINGGIHAKPISTINLNNQEVCLQSNKYGSKMYVNSTPSIISNIIYNNGIGHCFEDLTFFQDLIQFNAEKYLHGMNSSDFVEELYFRNLQRMISDENINNPLTIFVPETTINEKFGYAKSNLLYHFVEDQLWIEKEFSDYKFKSKMYNSTFCSSNKRLGGNCQKLRISKLPNGYVINEKYKILRTKPYQIGKTLIYTISEVLQLPGDFIQSLTPFYRCSTSLELLKKVNLLDLEPNQEGYTILLPCFDSWAHLDLNLEYLQGNDTATTLMMKNLILEGLIYSDSGRLQTQRTNILKENVTIFLDPHKEDVAMNLSSIKEIVHIQREKDVFFNQGVIHPLQHPYFSKNVSISLTDLIKTTGTSSFIHLLESFQDLKSILDNNDHFSLLIPTAESLINDGIGQNFTKLYDWLRLHIIPGNNTENLMECKSDIETTANEPLECRKSSTGNYFLRLRNGNENEVRVLKKGCTSSDKHSCVFLIDRPLSLQWLKPDKYHLKLPAVAVSIGIVVGAVSVLLFLFLILITCVGKSASRKDINQEAIQNGNDEARPLLNDNSIDSNSLAGPNDSQQRRFESSYSSNTSTRPIKVANTKSPTKIT